jgi:hypothetical protein
MGKKNDKIKPAETTGAQPDAQVASPVPVTPAPAPAAPAPVKAPAPAKAVAPAKTAAKKPAAKKPVAKGPVKKAAKKPAVKKAPAISADDISLRAYYISEHRHKHGIHGDSHSDWVEAERQLKAELKKAAAKKPALKKGK